MIGWLQDCRAPSIRQQIGLSKHSQMALHLQTTISYLQNQVSEATLIPQRPQLLTSRVTSSEYSFASHSLFRNRSITQADILWNWRGDFDKRKIDYSEHSSGLYPPDFQLQGGFGRWCSCVAIGREESPDGLEAHLPAACRACRVEPISLSK